jgi:hypothetical protein
MLGQNVHTIQGPSVALHQWPPVRRLPQIDAFLDEVTPAGTAASPPVLDVENDDEH